MNTLLMAGQTQLVLLNEKCWSTMQYSLQQLFLQKRFVYVHCTYTEDCARVHLIHYLDDQSYQLTTYTCWIAQ